MSSSTVASLLLLLSAFAPAILRPQGTPSRVVATVRSGGTPVARAQVELIAANGARVQWATTDTGGIAAMSAADVDTSWMVVARAIGFRPARVALRTGDDANTFLASITIERLTPVLAPVRVEGSRRKRPTLGEINSSDAGSAQQDASALALGADQQGSLLALGATIPGVFIARSADGGAGLSILGSPPSQSTTTMDGMPFTGGDLPRGVFTSARVISSPYDVSIGGFSAGLFSVRSYPGSDFTSTTMSITTGGIGGGGATSSPAGATPEGQIGIAGSGALVPRRLYYNGAIQLGGHLPPQGALRDPEREEPWMNEALSVLDSIGASAGGAARPGAVLGNGAIFGRLDAPRSERGTATLSVSGHWSQDVSGGAGALTAASRGDRVDGRSAGVMGELSRYVAGAVLLRMQTGLNVGLSNRRPATSLPAGQVVLVSGDGAQPSAGRVLLFGGSGANERARTWTWTSRQDVAWFSGGGAHRPKLSFEARVDRGSWLARSNGAGSFSFASIDALRTGRASSFSLTLRPTYVVAATVNAAAALGDAWRVTDRVSIQYGARLDANRALNGRPMDGSAPALLGVSSDPAPRGAHLSPRAGFTWMYGADRSHIGMGSRPKGMIRGGIGEFRGLLLPGALLPVVAESGVNGAGDRLVCLGSASPTPSWWSYRDGPASIPTTCADTATDLPDAGTRHDVTAMARGFSPPLSRRATLGWSGRVAFDLRLGAEVTYSVTLHTPRTRDLNFAGAQQFALANEADRPVFVPPDAIAPTTGAVATSASRAIAGFGHVNNLASNGRSGAGQIAITLSPGQLGPATRVMWSSGYTFTNAWDDRNGYDGSTAGDPRLVGRSPSTFAPRHHFVAALGVRLSAGGFVSLSSQLRSGLRYTPIVGSDVNGDGLANDRAFVFDDGANADSSVARSLKELMSGNSSANRCLHQQRGRTAAAGSCTGPWRLVLGANLTMPGRMLRLPQRALVTLSLTDAVGALDQLVHRVPRGWSPAASVDPVLLFARGFDADQRRFLYAVNSGFGQATRAAMPGDGPRLTMQVSIPLSRPQSEQLLDQVLEPGRHRAGPRRTAAQIKQRYMSFGIMDPVFVIYAARDSLYLTAEQNAELTRIYRTHVARLDSIWSPVASQLAGFDLDYDREGARRTVQAARNAAWSTLGETVGAIRSLLTPSQIDALAPEIAALLDESAIERLRKTEFRY